MSDTSSSGFNARCAALISAAIFVFIAVGWIFVAQTHAQAPAQIHGQITNGTKDVPPNANANVPVTLFQITTAGPVTDSVKTDSLGKFVFTNVITDVTAYFVRADYEGFIYFSDILTPDVAVSSPISMTVYETETVPANFTIDQLHIILDIQPKSFNGLELLQIANPTDRAFYLSLPVPNKTSDVQFEDIREQSTVIRQDDGTILYPILPTTAEILYDIALPFTPPNYTLQVPLKNNVAGVNLLVSKTGDINVSGNNFKPQQNFVSQSGQQYLVNTAPGQSAGTAFTAEISNLPGVDNTATLQTVVLVGGGLGGLALLAYPVYRRRSGKNAVGDLSDRISQLKTIAELDDAHDAGALSDQDYESQRAALKAELLKEDVESEA
jgi:hypothetical protein